MQFPLVFDFRSEQLPIVLIKDVSKTFFDVGFCGLLSVNSYEIVFDLCILCEEWESTFVVLQDPGVSWLAISACSASSLIQLSL